MTTMVRSISHSPPLSVDDLSRAVTLIGREEKKPFEAPELRSGAKQPRPNQLNPAALGHLRRLCEETGELHSLDVEVAARGLAHRSAKSLLSAYDAVKALKAKGALEDARSAQALSAPLAAKLDDPDLPPRIRGHIHRLAGQELLENVTDPIKDETLRSLLVDRYGGRTDAPPPDLTLRERNRRQTTALLAVLDDSRIKAPLRQALLKQLGEVGDERALPALQALAADGPAPARAAAEAAIAAIEKAQRMTIVLASFEVKPYVSGGGLGNVMRELPKALAKMGHRVIVLTPRHTTIDRDALKDTGARGLIRGGAHGEEPFQILEEEKDGVEIYFIENDKYFSANRYGVYGDQYGDYGDNWKRYDFFSASIPQAIRKILGDEAPDIVQLNDAHTGAAAAYLKEAPGFENTKTVMAIHNLGAAYQGIYGADRLGDFCFGDMGVFYPMGPAEFHGAVNLLKLGLTQADAAITVSRQYMKEILTRTHGEGLHGVLRALDSRGRLWGNLNGIDNDAWDPATDPALPAHFSYADQEGKAECKAALQRRFGLPEEKDVPVIGVVARLAEQKGWDDVIGNISRTLERRRDVQYVLMGQGDKRIAAVLERLARRYPRNVAFDEDFTMEKEHQIYGGGDFFLMPSKFEPCGLPQMYALRYLSVPIVRSVGGLEESIQQFDPRRGEGNGFKFTKDVDQAVGRALAWYHRGEEARQTLLRNCALSDFSWQTTSAVEQAAFFRELFR